MNILPKKPVFWTGFVAVALGVILWTLVTVFPEILGGPREIYPKTAALVVFGYILIIIGIWR